MTNPVQSPPIQSFTEPAPKTIRSPEEKKKPAVTPVKEPEIAKPVPPKPEPVNHAALGDPPVTQATSPLPSAITAKLPTQPAWQPSKGPLKATPKRATPP